MKSMLYVALVSTIVASQLAWAQGTGAEGYFEIHNDTDSNVVVGFYTNDGSGWSTNWLSDTLNPGERSVARFDAPSGSCEQTLRVGWQGEDQAQEVLDDPISIDICDSSNVYLGDNEITYD